MGTVGHTGTFGIEPSNALGELTSTVAGEILPQQVSSSIKESPRLIARECQLLSRRRQTKVLLYTAVLTAE